MTEQNLNTEPSNSTKPVLGDVVCGILANHLLGHIDNNGCIKKEAHNDNHIFIDQNGKLISWEEDFSCKCGCVEDWEKNQGEVCVVYNEVDNIS